MALTEPNPYAPRMVPTMPPDRLSIGRSLKAAREARGMTQEDVAFELRVRAAEHDSLGTVKRWETIGSIKLDDAVILASIYGMTVDELVSLDPEPPPHAPNGDSNDPDGHPSATQDLAGELSARDKAKGSRGQQRKRRRPPSSE